MINRKVILWSLATSILFGVTIFSINFIYVSDSRNNNAFPQPQIAQEEDERINDIKVNRTEPDLNKSNSSLNSIHEVLRFTQNHLVKKFEITVSDNDIKNYIQIEFDDLISEEAFTGIQENVDAQIAAAEDVVYNKASPEEAAERYLHRWGGAQAWADMLKTMNEERLNEMRAMAPSSISDMYEKSVPGHRKIVEGYELAKIVFDDEELDKNSTMWQDKYYEYLINYAKDNLVGKVPELMNINLDELQLQRINDNQSNQPFEHRTTPPLDRSKQNSNVGSFQ